MSKELIVSATRHETRVAILEDDQLVEIFHQREKEYSLAGSIHKGRVTRVLPGMQSAFVDIGLERDAFLYVSDFFEDNDEYDKIVSGVEEKVLKLERSGGTQLAATPVPAVLDPDAPVPLAVAVPGALIIQPAEVGAPQTAPPANGDGRRRQGGEPGGSRDNRDNRGGRGRRGRRRRPGGGGLPESKFFSPRDTPRDTTRDTREARPPLEPQPIGEAFVAPAAETNLGASSGLISGLSVLPGESISKYVGHTAAPPQELEPPPEFEEDGEPENVSAAQMASEVVHEEHDAAVMDMEAEAAGEGEPEDAETEEAVDTASGEGMPPVDETVFFEPTIEVPLEAGDELEFEGATQRLLEAAEAGAPSEEGEQGPEPARMPQSLTAALREQGGRLPHRMSRRSRRRMRGDRGGPDSGNAAGTPSAGANGETQVLAPSTPDKSEGKTEGNAPLERPQGNRHREDRPPREERVREEVRPAIPSITDLLRSGQEIIVQIAKEPLGQKGARITSHIALPGRFLVYMPTVDHIGVSRKIPSDEERQRLKRILQTHRTGIPGGFIVRTAGDGRSETELKADMMFLYSLWMDMRQKAEKKPAPCLLHHDLDVVERILRDQLTSAFKTVWVDNELIYESVLSFVQRFQPAMVSRIKLYTRPTPIFDEFGISQELEKALRPKVWLKSGGYIVINQTEALVAIDINTGKYVGKSNRLEDTIVKINTDAVKEIVRQIRLRDLGGIIVVDFIDMDERKNRQKVMQVLEETMRVDRAPYKILQFNDFGLVAITRKRVKQSLERALCVPCPYCEGAGSVKSVQTVIGEVLQEAHKIARAVEGDNVVLRVNPEVAKVLKSNSNDHLEEIESTLGKTVIIKSDPLLHQTKFDLA
jgi:ribonuclease G